MNTATLTLLGGIGLLGLAGALGAACSASGDNAGGTGGSGNGTGTSTSTTTGAGGSAGGLTTTSTSGTGGFGGACASVSSEATSEIQPADIIIAVDTSGSMDEESAEVQQNLNNFASIITASGIDVHVVLIAGSDVCIPAPLGSGACGGADESLPGYRHVVQSVGSNDALQIILQTYPQWQPSLRANASKTIAVVTDDDSDLGASSFMSQLIALDATFQGFKFDAIASSQDPDACVLGCFGGNPGVCCPGCVPLSAAEGTVYKQLAAQTGGVFGDLCVQDFDPVFASMATAVVSGSAISCEYAIPEVPPGGGSFDPDRVNVAYTPDGGMPHTIGYVAGGAAACGQQTGGWYYDDPANPTKIVLCPSTCSAVQADATGKVDVQFGCETIPAVPE